MDRHPPFISQCGAIAALGLLCFLSGCRGSQSGYDTPQAAFDAYLAAFEAENFAEAYDALSPDSKLYEVGRTVQNCGLSRNYVMEIPDDAPPAVVQAQENVRANVALLVEYNIELNDISDNDLLGAGSRMTLGGRVDDARGFYIDFLRTFTDYIRVLNDDPVPWDRPFFLENLVVEEDAATAQKVSTDRDLQLPFAFQRIDGRWYVDTTKSGF